jgi:flagellar motor switch/type III secretory pathway protein FliN
MTDRDAAGSDPFARMAPLADISLPSEIVLGEMSMTAREIMALDAGALLKLDRKAGSDLALYVNGVRLGWGRVVCSGELADFEVTLLEAEDAD